MHYAMINVMFSNNNQLKMLHMLSNFTAKVSLHWKTTHKIFVPHPKKTYHKNKPICDFYLFQIHQNIYFLNWLNFKLSIKLGPQSSRSFAINSSATITAALAATNLVTTATNPTTTVTRLTTGNSDDASTSAWCNSDDTSTNTC